MKTVDVVGGGNHHLISSLRSYVARLVWRNLRIISTINSRYVVYVQILQGDLSGRNEDCPKLLKTRSYSLHYHV